MNPIRAFIDYIHGEDLKVRPQRAIAVPEQPDVYSAVNTKYYQQDYGAALFGGMLVHGPGASELLGGVRTQDGNSAVFACLIALAMGFFEPAVRVYRTDGQGKKTALPNRPMQQLLDNPNPVMTSKEVWSWVAWQLNSDGNAYLRKVRAGNEITGNVVQLWPISPFCIEPITEKGSPNFLDYYKHDIGPGKWEVIDPRNIIHFKLGIDDADHRLGCAPIKRLIREIAGDEEAARFATQLLANSAVPGLVVEFPPEVTIDEPKADQVKYKVASAYGGPNRGGVGVLTGGAKMHQLGFSPEQMNLEALHNFPETRIAAVMRVPPAVAQLGVGLMQTSNYSSFHEVREMFTEQSLIPMWTLRDAKLMSQLWPDFESDRTISVATDLTDVRALQQDEDAKYKRLDLGVQGGWISVNEARTDVGLPTVEGGDDLKKATPPAQNPQADPNAPPTPIGSGRRAASRSDLDTKAATLDNLPDRLLAIVNEAQEPLTTQLERFQEQQHQRVRAAVGRGEG